MPAKVWESVEKPCMDYKPHQNSTSHMRIYQKLQVTYVTSKQTCNALTLSQATLFIKIKCMIQSSARNSITCILLLTQKFIKSVLRNQVVHVCIEQMGLVIQLTRHNKWIWRCLYRSECF